MNSRRLSYRIGYRQDAGDFEGGGVVKSQAGWEDLKAEERKGGIVTGEEVLY